MSMRIKSALCAAALACTGGAAFAASGFGDDPAPTWSHRYVTPALETASGHDPGELSLNRGGKHRRPKVTNLITTQPVAVQPNEEIVAVLKCTKKQGIPLSGGAISPPAPAQVAISVISRFDPNHPDRQGPRTYYVGVRNFDPVEAAEFRATLVCAKGVDQ
jgi:hypothetical protein